MATTLIPIPGDGYSAFSVDCKLDEVLYSFSFRWCDRAGAWFMSISDSAAVPIVSGVRVVTNWDLLRRGSDPRLPLGTLMALDPDVAGDPTLLDFGVRTLLTYTV